MRYALTDAEWRLIKPTLPCKPRGVPRVDDRRVLNGIFWVLRSGAPWRDLPERYGPYTTCYNRFVRWRFAGVWDRVLAAISRRDDADVQMIDSTIVRAHQHATCIKHGVTEEFGRSRGGLTTKIHAVVDGNGLPLRLALAPGHQHDSLSATALIEGLPEGGMLLADKAYDANAIRSLVASRGGWANIPPRRNRRDPICFSPYLYRDRNLVERFFNRIKHCRRIATRYEKRAANFLAFVKLAAIRLWLGVYESTA
ncbi:IS5 family transposase [Limibaculum sp. FT325]|uniref:IS5 family transposase n=1 Tax=Thermohalobaculum sediminis TaxID=2939436 RepID=UPI0020BEFA4A|nr:IS5 family transposase [Limibaculum sediminis]MCL5776448.1 IS5 family transposase [Limibaculum sediminis]